MTKLLIPCTIFAALISCRQNSTSKISTAYIDTPKIEIKNLPVDKISFDFTVAKKEKKSSMVNIHASLINSYQDTVYFLTWTCDGLLYDLVYDSTKMDLFLLRVCNGTFPMIEKIPPNSKFDFDANFILKTKNRKISLGYNFCRVEKNFDINGGLEQIRKYENERQKIILSAKEMLIE